MKQKQLLMVAGLAVAVGVAVWYFQRQRVTREQGGTVTDGAKSTAKSTSTATVVPQPSLSMDPADIAARETYRQKIASGELITLA